MALLIPTNSTSLLHYHFLFSFFVMIQNYEHLDPKFDLHEKYKNHLLPVSYQCFCIVKCVTIKNFKHIIVDRLWPGHVHIGMLNVRGTET